MENLSLADNQSASKETSTGGKASLQWKETPPTTGEGYVVSNFEGERLTIPGSKGVFRILASAKQTHGRIAVFTSAAVLSDAPGFHYHNEAHDVFLVTKGFLKLWNGDKCRILGPGDFAYVPPVCLQLLEPKDKLILCLENHSQSRTSRASHRNIRIGCAWRLDRFLSIYRRSISWHHYS